MAEDKIDSIVDQKAYKQLDDLAAKLALSQKGLIDNIDAAIKLNSVLGNSKSLPDMEKNATAAAIAMEKLKQSQIQTELSQQRLTAAQLRAEQQANKHTQAANEQTRAYVQLDNELKKATKAAQDLGIAHGANSETFKKAAKEVKELRDKFVDIDAALGLHNRTVGDYKNQIVNALQELLPFGSELGRVSQSVEEFSPVLGAAIEAMGGFAVAVTGVTVAAGALIAVPLASYLTSTQDGEDKVRLVTNELKIVFDEAKGSVQDFGRAIADVFSEKRSSEGVAYWIEIKKAAQEFFNIASGGASKKFTLFSDETVAKAKEITELQKQVEENENKLILATGRLNRQFQEQADIARDVTLTGEEGEKKRKEAAMEAIATSRELQNLRTEDLQEQLKLLKLQQSINHNDAERRESVKAVKTLEAQIEQTVADGLKERRRITSLMRNLELADIKEIEAEEKKASDAEKKRLKEALEVEKKKQELQQKYFDDQIKSSKTLLDNRVKQADGEIKAQDELAKQIEAINSDTLKHQQASVLALSKTIEDAEAKKKKLLEQADKDAIDLAERDEKRRQEKYESIITYEKEAFDVATAFLSAKFELEKNALSEIESQQQKSFEAESERIRASLLSDQDKANKLQILESQRAAQKAQNDRKEREIEIRKAKFDRETALFEIAITTALNIIKLWLTPPLAIAAGIAGAAQAAAVLAAPLPKFKEGGKMRETGLAEFGHGQELRIDPDGKVSLTGSTPEVGIVQKGTQFISNKELVRMIAKPDQIVYAGGAAIDMKDVISATEKSGKRIENAIYSAQPRNRGTNYYSTSKGRAYLNRNIN